MSGKMKALRGVMMVRVLRLFRSCRDAPLRSIVEMDECELPRVRGAPGWRAALESSCAKAEVWTSEYLLGVDGKRHRRILSPAVRAQRKLSEARPRGGRLPSTHSQTCSAAVNENCWVRAARLGCSTLDSELRTTQHTADRTTLLRLLAQRSGGPCSHAPVGRTRAGQACRRLDTSCHSDAAHVLARRPKLPRRTGASSSPYASCHSPCCAREF